MTTVVIAERYTRALLALAQDSQKVDDYARQLKEFVAVLRQFPDLLRVLANKGHNVVQRINVLNQVLAKTAFDAHVKNFLRILIKKGRMDLIETICTVYAQMADGKVGRCPMTVVSAAELPAEQYRELETFFGLKLKKQMVLSKKTDSHVLGGVRVHIGDQVYDYTLKRQLDDLARSMMN